MSVEEKQSNNAEALTHWTAENRQFKKSEGRKQINKPKDVPTVEQGKAMSAGKKSSNKGEAITV